MKVEISDESLDEAVFTSVHWHLEYSRTRLRRLKAMKNPKSYEKQDIAYLEKLVPAMAIVAEYYAPQ
jgi:hypothetical protein